MDASKFVSIGLLLTTCAFIFQVIGLASPYWIFAESGGNKFYSARGLWKSCQYTKETDESLCADMTQLPDWFEAVRATSILGFLSVLVALVMIILKMFVIKDNKPVLFVAIGTAFVGAIFVLVSIAVYASKLDELSRGIVRNYYHFAFAFCIIAMLAALGAGASLLVGVVKAL